jgi:hypothetical protein
MLCSLITSSGRVRWRCIVLWWEKLSGRVDVLGHCHASNERADRYNGCLACADVWRSGVLITKSHSSGEKHMDMSVEKKSFNKRAFVSIGMLVSALFLPFSGILNHELGFEPLTQNRHFWMSIHNMAAFLFVFFAILHMSLNWRALIHYVKQAKEVMITREALAAIMLVVTIVVVFSSHAFHAG